MNVQNVTRQYTMSFFSKSGLFLFIVCFSGAMVVLGARDMHRNLKAPVEHEIQRADRLLHALRGDELFRAQAKYDQPNQNLPQRRTGSYLPDYDLKKIKAFLVGLIGGMGDDESHVEPDKKQAEPE